MSKKDDKKQLAKILYIDSALSQTDIAERLGISQPQVSRWVAAEGWDVLRTSNKVTPKQLIINLQRNIHEISELPLKEQRVMSPAETDQISKLSSSIRDLDRSYDLPTFIQGFEEFLDFMKDQDEDLMKTLPDYIYQFLAKKARELSK